MLCLHRIKSNIKIEKKEGAPQRGFTERIRGLLHQYAGRGVRRRCAAANLSPVYRPAGGLRLALPGPMVGLAVVSRCVPFHDRAHDLLSTPLQFIIIYATGRTTRWVTRRPLRPKHEAGGGGVSPRFTNQVCRVARNARLRGRTAWGRSLHRCRCSLLHCRCR